MDSQLAKHFNMVLVIIWLHGSISARSCVISASFTALIPRSPSKCFIIPQEQLKLFVLFCMASPSLKIYENHLSAGFIVVNNKISVCITSFRWGVFNVWYPTPEEVHGNTTFQVWFTQTSVAVESKEKPSCLSLGENERLKIVGKQWHLHTPTSS